MVFEEERLNKLLEQARKEEEERIAKIRKKQQNREHAPQQYAWIKYAVYAWAIRSSFLLFGGTIPILSNLYHLIYPMDRGGTYTVKVSSFTWKELIKTDFDDLLRFKTDNNAPFVVESIPIMQEGSLEVVLSAMFAKLTTQVKTKVSDQPIFTYFDEDRAWSTLLAHKKDCIQRLLDQKVQCISQADQGTLSNSIFETLLCSKSIENQYYYLSYGLSPSYAESLAPSLSLLSSALNTAPAQSNIWISTANVTAQWHYDTQDNFLLQLSGIKQVTVMSPEALRVLRPYPSLHPLWRQAAVSTFDPHTSSQIDTSVIDDVNGKSVYNESFTTWQVTLKPGSALYIPAGYYHHITAETNSISINSWYASAFSLLYPKLLRVALPFDRENSVEVKVTNLIAVLANICLIWETDRKCLLRELQHRFDAVLAAEYDDRDNQSSEKECDLQTTYCTKISLQIAESRVRNTRVANAIHATVAKSRLPFVLQVLTIMEYVEEVLRTVIFHSKEENNKLELKPCTIGMILAQCSI